MAINNRKKITELTEISLRPTHYFDEFGNRVRGQEEYVAKRNVRSVKVGPRIGHFVTDLLLLQIIGMVVTFLVVVFDLITKSNSAVNLSIELVANIILLIMCPGLYVLSEHFLQRTPGKYLTKTLVINEYGDRPELKAIILRSIIRMIPFEPFSCFDIHSRGWHDEWSKTWVVPEEELTELKKLQQEQSAN